VALGGIGIPTVFGWLVRVFDQASNLVLRALRIEPVHDVEHAATARDFEHVVEESRVSGDLPAELPDGGPDSGAAGPRSGARPHRDRQRTGVRGPCGWVSAPSGGGSR
jgi:hypothetical protein